MADVKSYTTMTEAMKSLKVRGYTQDFNLHHDRIECPPLDLRMKPEEFHVDEVHRLLVDAYGVYSESMSTEMIEKLRIDSSTKH